MTDWPEEARVAAVKAIDATGVLVTAPMAMRLATDILDAVAPILAEAGAQKILGHAERQHPRDPDHVPTAWHRHMDIAARVAAGAFWTREDQLRMAAEAISEGRFIACHPPEG